MRHLGAVRCWLGVMLVACRTIVGMQQAGAVTYLSHPRLRLAAVRLLGPLSSFTFDALTAIPRMKSR